MTPAESERRYDDLLRQKLAHDAVLPPAALWQAVSATLPPPPARVRWRPLGVAAFLGLLTGLLVGWWAAPHLLKPRAPLAGTTTTHRVVPAPGTTKTMGSRHPATRRQLRPSPPQTPAPSHGPKATGRALPRHPGMAQAVTSPSTTAVAAPATPTPAHPMPAPGPLVAVAPSSAPSTAPHIRASIWQAALAQDSAIRQEAARAVAPTAAESPNRLPALVVAQRRMLRMLQHRLDSLKAALPAEPPVLALTDSLPAAFPDSAQPPTPARAPRWGLALLAEATQPWAALPSAPDTRQPLGAANSRSLQVEYRLPHDRWLVRAGIGELRLTGRFQAVTERTGQQLVSDTLLTTRLDVAIRIDTTHIIHIDSVLHLNPRVNASLQIIGYDSLWVPNNDTIYQVSIAHDTLRRTTQTVYTRLDTWRERREQQLRPTYRFWTLPLAVQYDVLRAGRWRAGLSLGAQLLFFRGGEQPVRQPDGSYALRHLDARGGPFRPVSASLSTALAVRYRLTDHLSLLAAGGGSGWVAAPVRGAARPPIRLTGQVGISWGLGR